MRHPKSIQIIPMKVNEPPLQLIRVWENEWRFHESQDIQRATLRFDVIWEKHNWDKKLGTPLKKFLTECPVHIDGLYHYAMHKLNAGQLIDAYAYVATAVATAKAVIPPRI